MNTSQCWPAKTQCTQISAVLLMLALVGCASAESKLSSPMTPVCMTTHSGGGISVAAGTPEFVVPLAVESNRRGLTTIVLPTEGNQISASLLIKDKSGWHGSKKNQVVLRLAGDSQKSIVDFSPNLRITQGERRVLVLKVPVDRFPIALQPVVGASRVAGESLTYPVRVAAGGIQTPFQTLEQSIQPGQLLSNDLAQLLDKTHPGDLMIPARFSTDTTIKPIRGTDSNLCPLSS